MSEANSEGVCPDCGTEVEEEFVGGSANHDAEVIVWFRDHCPNPDCPSKESDLAPRAVGDDR